MIYIGIDPGFSGGFGAILEGGMHVEDMPLIRKGGGDGYNALDLEAIVTYLRGFNPVSLRVGLENPTTRPGEGAERCFRFGRQVGNLEAILHTLGINYTLISPVTWTKKLGFPGKQYDNAIAIRAAWLDERYPEAKALYTGPRGGLLDGRIDS